MLLKEMELEYKYQDSKISNRQYKSQIEKCELIIDNLESIRKNSKSSNPLNPYISF